MRSCAKAATSSWSIPAPGTKFQPTAGKLVENLKAAGIEPATVTKVILTHGHPDHIWGTTDANGALLFPNATYYVGAAEWNFWMDPDLIGKMPPEMGDFVKGAQREFGAVKDRVTMLKPGDDVVTGNPRARHGRSHARPSVVRGRRRGGADHHGRCGA